MLRVSDDDSVKETLARDLGVKVVVDKIRRIYLKDNVRVHVDEVRRLGQFVEIEAVGQAKDFKKLKSQAEVMARILGLRRSDLVGGSYSDLLPKSGSR